MEEIIRINRAIQIILDFDESLPKETVASATVVIIVIATALMQNGITIQKVELHAEDDERVKILFYGKAGECMREYVFYTAMLIKAVQKAGRVYGLQHEKLKDKILEEINQSMDNLTY